MDPGAHCRVLFRQGTEAFRERNYDSAIELFHQILNYFPRNAKALTNLGALYYRKRNYHEAFEYFEKCIAIDPEFAPAHEGLQKVRAKLQ